MKVLLMSVLLALSACSVARPDRDATGEEIYQLLCSNCHGEDLAGGALGPSLGAGSVSASLPDTFVEFAVVNGKGSMPSFDLVLDEVQLRRLMAYLREVQRR